MCCVCPSVTSRVRETIFWCILVDKCTHAHTCKLPIHLHDIQYTGFIASSHVLNLISLKLCMLTTILWSLNQEIVDHELLSLFSQNLKITTSITHFANSVGLLCERLSQYQDGHVSVKPTEWPGRIIRIRGRPLFLHQEQPFCTLLSKWLSSIRSYFNGVIYLIFILIQNLLRDYRAYIIYEAIGVHLK